MSENRAYGSQHGAGYLPSPSNEDTDDADDDYPPPRPPEPMEHRARVCAEDGCSLCVICGRPVDQNMEWSHAHSVVDSDEEEDFNEFRYNEPSDNPQPAPPVEINLSISAGGSPITIGISGGQFTSNQGPISFNVGNRNSPNVIVQIQPNGTTVVPEQAPPNASGEFVPPNYESVLRCPICFRSAINPRATSCGHLFCEPCLRRALSTRCICPVCGVAQEYHNTLPVFP
ncbi:uncharacterized protein LOC108115278 [Drosophila eugracilis]|uniref:uncharacterized protein LOC108115278 n=1 Tax=Drosophila eugracilis TaxID=29029 RepID=UPI0007E73C05|nr:uncharacterized protein LOC108115278 [Drosophila eugracilis]